MDICHDDDAAVSINDSHKDEDDCNNCSPFAVCGQCTGFSFMVPSILLAPPQKMIEQKFATSLGIYNSPLLFPLFQPPRA